MTPTRFVLLGLAALVLHGGVRAQAKPDKKKDDKKVVWEKVGPVPEQLRTDWKLSDFYSRYADAKGIPVLAAAGVDDRALQVAAELANRMLANREDVREKLIENKVRIGVILKSHGTADMPEYDDLTDKAAWNARARGLGAVIGRPLSSVGKENLLGLPNDRYKGESVFVHEFAHSMHLCGLSKLAPEFDATLKAAYKAAQDKNLWQNTYALRNEGEYWAEGVQSYFDCNLTATPPDGIHNNVNTRDRLKAYDPRLFKIIDTAFKADPWRCKPPVAGVTIPAPPVPAKTKK